MNLIKTLEEEMFIKFHERQLKTLEQGINNIEVCVRRNRLFILFIYENEIVHGKISYINDKYFTIKNKNYYFDKIYNIYSYFTFQKLSLEQLYEWYLMDDEEELV